jgi:hypothetical protein
MRLAVVLVLAAALTVSPAAEAKRHHGKAKKNHSVSVRFKAKKDKRPGKERLRRVRTPRVPQLVDRVPLGPPVVVPTPTLPPRTDDVFYCMRYLLVDGDLAYVCGQVGKPDTSCIVTEPDGSLRRPCPPGVPPFQEPTDPPASP